MTFDKLLARLGLQRVSAAPAVPAPPPGEARPPRKHFEYFVDPTAEGFDWTARAYLYDMVNTAEGRPMYIPFVEETNGVAFTRLAAREAAIAWGKKMTGETK
jgi:hypothetical protein